MADYFTSDTDKSIVAFIVSDVSSDKERIFTEEIRPAFEKLIENLIRVYGFYNIDDMETLKKDCLSNLYEMLPKYDPAKGTKGFSYFNVVAKNWFIQRTKERSKRGRLESELYCDLDHEFVKSDPNFSLSPHEDLLEEKEWWARFYGEMETWRPRLLKKSEKQVLEAVIFLMRNPDFVSIYNKKAVYLYLREITGLNTKQVVVNLKKIKELFSEWQRKFNDNGE